MAPIHANRRRQPHMPEISILSIEVGTTSNLNEFPKDEGPIPADDEVMDDLHLNKAAEHIPAAGHGGKHLTEHINHINKRFSYY